MQETAFRQFYSYLHSTKMLSGQLAMGLPCVIFCYAVGCPTGILAGPFRDNSSQCVWAMTCLSQGPLTQLLHLWSQSSSWPLAQYLPRPSFIEQFGTSLRLQMLLHAQAYYSNGISVGCTNGPGSLNRPLTPLLKRGWWAPQTRGLGMKSTCPAGAVNAIVHLDFSYLSSIQSGDDFVSI